MIYCNFELKDEQTLKTSQALPEGFTVKYIGEPGSQTEKLTYVGLFNLLSRTVLISDNYSAKQSVTGGPFFTFALRDLRMDGAEGRVEKLAKIIDGYLAKPELSPLTRAQYEVQRRWLIEEDARVVEGMIMFASFPGMAGMPTPTGGMSLWLPISHTVSPSRRFRV